ncbi:MAG: hypothetical protein WD824_05415 [Cyclobacteriaceae bacterium]
MLKDDPESALPSAARDVSDVEVVVLVDVVVIVVDSMLHLPNIL